jgi:hypothetical protein
MFSFLNPYLLFIKIGAGIALLAGLLFAWYHIVETFREQGREEIQLKWNKADQILHTAEQGAIQKRNEDNARQLLLYEAHNQEVRREYERRIELQNRDNARDIADLRAAGGLRIKLPTTVCNGFASKANAESTRLDNEASSTRLPEQIEDDLFQFANERDQEIILLGSCQKWIKDNGLYMEQK